MVFLLLQAHPEAILVAVMHVMEKTIAFLDPRKITSVKIAVIAKQWLAVFLFFLGDKQKRCFNVFFCFFFCIDTADVEIVCEKCLFRNSFFTNCYVPSELSKSLGCPELGGRVAATISLYLVSVAWI